MSIRQVVTRTTAAGAAALPLVVGAYALLAGCVSMSGDVQSARLSDNFQIYAPFDNERDWGPSYLVGAPAHHLGDESRIDDTRAPPQSSEFSPADPKGPPLTASPTPATPQAPPAPQPPP